MDASPRKVEHAKAPAASADPAADLALVKRLRDRHLITRFAIEVEAADAIERLLRERDAITALLDRYELGRPCSRDGGKTWEPWPFLKRVEIACMAAADQEDRERAEKAEAERDAARGERDELRRRLREVGDV